VTSKHGISGCIERSIEGMVLASSFVKMDYWHSTVKTMLEEVFKDGIPLETVCFDEAIETTWVFS